MRRLGPRQVILLAENKHDDVGVLLDRAGFTQIRQLRPLVLALLDGPRELRAGDHRHFQFLGDCFQAAGDVGDFLDAVLHGAALRRGTHQLQVVDDDHAEPLLTLEAARAGAQGGDGERRRIVDIERHAGEAMAGRDEFVEILAPDLAAADAVGGGAGFF